MNSALVALGVIVVLAQVYSHPVHPVHDVIIRNPKSQLVLDGKNNVVTVEKENGEKSQIWQLISSDLGTFYIQNKATGNVIVKERRGEGAITTQFVDQDRQQQWYIGFNKTIANAYNGQVLNAEFGDFIPGNRVVVINYTHGKHQIFGIEAA